MSVDYMSRANIDPKGLMEFFERLDKAQGKFRLPSDLLATHPFPSDRLHELRLLTSNSNNHNYVPINADLVALKLLVKELETEKINALHKSN